MESGDPADVDHACDVLEASKPGDVVAESAAACRHVARKHGLDGTTDDERTTADMARARPPSPGAERRSPLGSKGSPEKPDWTRSDRRSSVRWWVQTMTASWHLPSRRASKASGPAAASAASSAIEAAHASRVPWRSRRLSPLTA